MVGMLYGSVYVVALILVDICMPMPLRDVRRVYLANSS